MTVAAPASAGPVALGLGFETNTLAANDDGSTGLVNLPFSANFFGTTYTSLYANNNGNVTFNSPLSTFTPFGLGAGYTGQPIIAPFFADVDTRGAGSALMAYGNGTYAGRTAFGVTWDGVGYFAGHTNLLNTFQLVLTDRSDVGAGDFDIYFNYDEMLWETGDASGGVGGFGGACAAAGFSNGTAAPGTFFQLPGSLTCGALIDGGPNALSENSNVRVTGQYRFQVRNGGVIVPPIDGGPIPEPATWAMMLVGFFGLGGVLRRRRSAIAPAHA